ncbi:MAG: hypothetical protein ACOZNI_18355, partial [Myxococcota bacterium]
MTLRLRDHLQWQDSTNLDAFITRLTDTEERVRENLRTFVVGEKVRTQLDALFGEMGRRLADNRDIGRYVYGSFGSGKSHLLTVVGKMLERDEEVYDRGHPALRKLRADHPWLDQQRVLVVRLNMMGKRSLTTALYEAFNEALPARVPRLSFTDEARVFQLIDRDAERLGGMNVLLEQIVAARALDDVPGWPVGMPAPLLAEWIQRMRSGDLDKRLALAAALQNWRNHGQDPIRPDDLWLDARPGLDRIARHAQDHGYTAIAWLIDELVIWIRGKSRAEYIHQLNNLSAMVDHDAARVLPFFVAVAIQQDIARTCPDDLSESDFQAQLGFIKDRFDPRIQLEDQDLYAVAAERVLARNPDRPTADAAAFEGAIEDLFGKNREAIAAFSGDLPLDFVRRLYPFHPALLRILVDVTQALSRNRTAVAALYVLLNQYANMTPGKFIPVGALWDFVFTNENVQAMRGYTSSRFNQRVCEAYDTYQRLEGKIDAVARDANADPAMLRQLVRTVLLCQLSDRPYFPDGSALRERITASMLLRLNEADVTVVHERAGISRIGNLFRKLQGVAPQVQISGGEADPTLHVKTEQVDIEKVLATARANVGFADRFAYIRRLLNEQLGLGLKDGREATVDVQWRGTKRRGVVRIRNVRTLSYAGQQNEFDPGTADFLILVDYPFDEEAGKGRDDDVQTVDRARARSSHWTLSWLPTHFSASEREALDNAAAVELIRKDERAYFNDVSPREADATRRALESFQAGRKIELEQAIVRLYFDGGLIAPSKQALGSVNLAAVDHGTAVDALATHVLDKRYPNHPEFRRKVVSADLAQVADWVIRAAKTGKPLDLRAAEMALVDAIAWPLELVHKGAGSITPRLDGRYLARVREWIGDRRAFEATELRERLMAEWDPSRPRDADNWGFGFTKELANLWLLYLLQVEEFEARVNERSTTISGLSELPEKFRLVKDEVVDPPTWDKALRVAERLLDVRGRAELPTSPEQAKLCRDVAAPANAQVEAARLFETRFREVAQWAQVDPDQCARVNAVREIIKVLDGVVAEARNAERCRRLAKVAEPGKGGAPSPLSAYEQIRKSLADETTALADLAPYKTHFQHVATAGDEADRTAVVTRLRNVLKDPWDSTRLREALPAWSTEATKRFEAILQRKPSVDDEAAKREAEQKARAEAAAKAAEAEARRGAAEEERRRAEQAQ